MEEQNYDYAAYICPAAVPTSVTSLTVSLITPTAISSHEVPMTSAAAMVPSLTTYYNNNVLLIITLSYTDTSDNLITSNTQW